MSKMFITMWAGHISIWDIEKVVLLLPHVTIQVSNSYNVTSRRAGPEGVLACCWVFPADLYLLDKVGAQGHGEPPPAGGLRLESGCCLQVESPGGPKSINLSLSW